MLFRQLIRLALSLAFAKAGRSRAARIAMMAMTTSSSIKVNALLRQSCIGSDRRAHWFCGWCITGGVGRSTPISIIVCERICQRALERVFREDIGGGLVITSDCRLALQALGKNLMRTFLFMAIAFYLSGCESARS